MPWTLLVMHKPVPSSTAKATRADRVALLASFAIEDRRVTQLLEQRFSGMPLTYMPGARAWSIEWPEGQTPDTRRSVLSRLAGLPVELASDATFHALSNAPES